MPPFVASGRRGGKTATAADLMGALVAAGGTRLYVALDWHAAIWTGRPRPATPALANDLRRAGYQPKYAEPGFYRFPQQQKRARRFLRAQKRAEG